MRGVFFSMFFLSLGLILSVDVCLILSQFFIFLLWAPRTLEHTDRQTQRERERERERADQYYVPGFILKLLNS